MVGVCALSNIVACILIATLCSFVHGRAAPCGASSVGCEPPQRFEDTLMNIVVWLVIGGLIGWLASLVMRTAGQQGILLNVIVGVVGAIVGGWLLSPLVGVSTINQSNFSVPGLLVSLAGAVILLAVVNLVRRRSLR